jgi:hypothetical protein
VVGITHQLQGVCVGWGRCILFREVCCWLHRGLLFQATAQYGLLLLTGSASHLSRLPIGCLCYLGSDFLHVVLVLKISHKPSLGSLLSSGQAGCTKLQMFLRVFCCFNLFRFRQSSASCCLKGPGLVFPGPSVSMFLWVCGAPSGIRSYQQTAVLNLLSFLVELDVSSLFLYLTFTLWSFMDNIHLLFILINPCLLLLKCVTYTGHLIFIKYISCLV